MFSSGTWQSLIKNVMNNSSTLHFIGLFSDGNVHSHIDHLKAMIERAKIEVSDESASIFCLTGVMLAKHQHLIYRSF